MASLNGMWSYRGFRGEAKETPHQIAVPWAPPGTLESTTDGSGKVAGKLTLPLAGVTLAVAGTMTPADPAHLIPKGVALTGEVTREGNRTIYKIRGFFVP